MSGSTTSGSTQDAVGKLVAALVPLVTAAMQPQLAAMQAQIEKALEAAAESSSQLPAAGTLTSKDGVPIVQGGSDVLASQTDLAAFYVQQTITALAAGVQALAPAPTAGG